MQKHSNLYRIFMKDQQAPMEEALRAKGVRFVSKLYGDENNRLGHVFHCNIRDINAAAANREQLEFFRSSPSLIHWKGFPAHLA